MLEMNIASPVTASAYEGTKMNKLPNKIAFSKRKVLLDPPVESLYSVVGEVLFWELYHHVVGKNSRDLLEKTRKKVDFILKYKEEKKND